MLELALDLQEAINRFATYDKRYILCPSEEDWDNVTYDKRYILCPSKEDWDNVQTIIWHLKVFHDATNKLSGFKYPILNLYFPEFCEIYLNIKKMRSSPYPFFVQMSIEMFAKWDKYWSNGNALLAITCVLDPRCKLAVIEYYYNMMHSEDCVRFMTNIKGMLACFIQRIFECTLKGNTKPNWQLNSEVQCLGI
jgi:subtilase family serine protease